MVYPLFILEILCHYTMLHWEQDGNSRHILNGLIAWTVLMLFLCCAGSARLGFLEIIVILLVLAVWLAMRNKKGVFVVFVITLVLFFDLIYSGKNSSSTLLSITTLNQSDGIRAALLKNSW